MSSPKGYTRYAGAVSAVNPYAGRRQRSERFVNVRFVNMSGISKLIGWMTWVWIAP